MADVYLSLPITDVSLIPGAVSGTGAAGQVSYWSGTSTQTGNAGLTYTPNTLTVGDGVGTAGQFMLNAPNAQQSSFHFMTAGLIRWDLFKNSTTESGSNAGSNLVISSFNDDGSLQDTPINIVRLASGNITLARSLFMTSVSFAAFTPTTTGVTAGGAVTDGAHLYKVAPVTATGEGLPSAASASITTGSGNNTVPLTIPVSTNPNVTSRAIYRTKAGGTEYFLVAIVANNTATLYTDIIADASLTNRKTSPASFTCGINSDFSIGQSATAANLMLGTPTTVNSLLSINGAAGSTRGMRYMTANGTRWAMGASSTAESGSNAGSNYSITAYDDAGVSIDIPLSIVRAASGTITWSVGRNMGIGITPVTKLHLDSGNATASAIKLTAGTTTGTTATDGFNLGITTAGVIEFRQYENLDMVFYTNNTSRLTIAASGELTIANLAPASSAMVESSSAGLLSASKRIIQSYITDGTAQAALVLTSNWDVDGNYTGTSITGTYQGQKHYNTEYLFEAYADNSWLRIPRA